MRCDIRVAQVFEMVEWKGIGKGYWGVYKNYIPKVPFHGKGTTWFGVFTRWSLDNKHCTLTNCTLIFDLCVQSCTMATSRYYLKLTLCSSWHNNNNKTAAKFVLISFFLYFKHVSFMYTMYHHSKVLLTPRYVSDNYVCDM